MAITPLTFTPSNTQGNTPQPTTGSIKPITFNPNTPNAPMTVFGNPQPTQTSIPTVKAPSGGFKIGDVISGIENTLKGGLGKSLSQDVSNIESTISNVGKVIGGLKLTTQSAPTTTVSSASKPVQKTQSKAPVDTILNAFHNALTYTPGIALVTKSVEDAKKGVDVLNGFLGQLKADENLAGGQNFAANPKSKFTPANPQQQLGSLVNKFLSGITEGNGGVNSALEEGAPLFVQTVADSPLGPKLGLIKNAVDQLATDGSSKFAEFMNKLKPIDINIEDVRAVTLGKGTPDQIGKFTAATNLMEKNNMSMQDILAASKEGSPLTKVYDFIKNSVDAVTQSLKDTLTPREQLLLDTHSSSPIEKAVMPGTYTPGDLVQKVVDAGLENTSEGKQFVKEAASASRTGDSIVISSETESPMSTMGALSDVRQQVQDIKSISTPDDAVLNPIADQVDAIIKENEHQGIQSSPAEGKSTQIAQSPNGETSQNSNIEQKSSISSQSNQITESGQGNGVDNGGKSENSVSNTASSISDANGSGESLKVSKIAKEIDAKSIEANLTKGFSELAGYTPVTIKGQAEMATKLVNNHFDEAMKVVRGEVELPKDLKGVSLVNAVENYLKVNPDGQVALDLARSPLVTGTSQAAQELRLAAERDPYSPTELIKQLEDDRRAVITKKTGQTVEKQTAKVVEDIKSAIKKTVPTKKDWQSFIDSIEC